MSTSLNDNIKILHLEDIASDAELIEIELQDQLGNVDLKWVDSKRGLIAELKSGIPYDLVLSDYSVPDVSDLEALKIVKEASELTPFIYVTGALGEELAVEVLKSGATDYVLKDQLYKLPLAIQRALEEAKQKREKLEAYRALEQNEIKYRKIFESYIDVYYEASLDGVIQTITPSCKDMFGYDQHEVLGSSVSLFYKNPEERELMMKMLIERGCVKDYETIITHKNGKDVHVSAQINLRFDGQNKPSGIYGVVRDITEFTLAKRNVESSESRLRGIMEVSSEITCIINEEGVIQHVGPSIGRILKYKEQDLLGKNVFSLIHPDDYEDAKTRFAYRLRTGGQPEPRTYRFFTKDNEQRYLQVLTNNLLDNPHINGIIVNAQDVTDLRISNALLEKITEQAPGVIFKFEITDDKTMKFPFLSKGFAEMNPGVSIEEVKEKPYLGLGSVHPDDLEMVEKSIWDSFESLSVWDVHYRIITRNEGVRWIAGMAKPERQKGKVSWYGTLHDVTERKMSFQKGIILNKVGSSLNLDMSLEQFCYKIHNSLVDNIEFDTFYVNLLDKQVNKIKPIVYLKDGIQQEVNNVSRPFGRGLTETVIETGENFVVDPENAALFQVELGSDYFGNRAKSWLGVPLKAGNEVIGVLALQCTDRKHRYSVQEIELVSLIGSQLGAYIQKRTTREKLKQREARYRTLFERNLAGVYRASLDDRILECNDAFASIIGYNSSGQVEGKFARELYKNDTTSNFVREIKENGEVLKSYESCITRLDGTKVWLLENASIVRDTVSNEELVEGTVLDITSLKESFAKLDEERRYALKYQSMLLSSQLNPHFIFNALNSVQFYILDKDPEPALNFVSEFSQLMRAVLNNSAREKISLAEEIEFLELYLNLEKRRFRDKFTYDINVQESVDPDIEHIAPMLLQPYVENTIVHGIGNLEKKGKLEIEFNEYEDNLVCIIDDNGVGREKAMELKKLRSGNQHKSMAMGITGSRLELLNKLEGNNYKVNVIDKKGEDGSVQGTRVIIRIPKEVEIE